MGDLPLDDSGAVTPVARLWADELGEFPEPVLLDAVREFGRTQEWPMTISQLRAACFGIPSLGAVRQELTARDASPSGFARLVWMRLDRYALTRADEDKAGRMIREAYELTRENVLAGRETIPESSPAIEEPKPAPVYIEPHDPERAAAIISEARKRLGLP